MKTLLHCSLLAVLILFLSSLSIAQEQKKSARQYYSEAVALYNAGKYAEALPMFQLLHQKNPRHPQIHNYYLQSKMQAAKIKPGASLEAKLKEIIVPEVEFADAPLSDVLEYLSKRTEELSGGKVVANIVFSGQPEVRDNKKITLKLRNVPMTDLISYVGRVSSCGVRFEKYAIVLSDLTRATAAAAPVTQEVDNNPFD